MQLKKLKSSVISINCYSVKGDVMLLNPNSNGAENLMKTTQKYKDVFAANSTVLHSERPTTQCV